MAVTPLPTPPSSSNPSFFDPNADAFLGALPQFALDMQEVLNASYGAVAAAIGTIAASVTTSATLQATTGTKSFPVETGKAIIAGVTMTFKQNGNAANSFTGPVTAYNASTGDLTINATSAAGSSASASGWQGVVTKATPETGTLMVRYELASGTNSADSLAAGAWTGRNLNTVHANTITGASLGSNQVTLPAGAYEVVANGVLQGGNAAHQLRLRNVTDNTTVLAGMTDRVPGGPTGRATLEGRFTISAFKTFALQHYVSAASNGGLASSTGEAEIYASLTIRKVG
jgi:nitrogen fixation protein FixH